MTRDVLQAILRAADGITEKAGVYRVSADCRATFYLGTEGRGMTVNEVDELKLADGFLSLSTRENGVVYADYGSVFAVSTKETKGSSAPRAGFA